jgi:hypothetical protein
LSALARIEPNNKKAIVGSGLVEFETHFFEASALFGFMLAFARVMSVLKSGHPA